MTTAAAAPLLLACVVSHLVVPTRLLLSIETQNNIKQKTQTLDRNMQNNMKRRNKTVKTKNTSTPTDTIKPKYKHTKNRTLNQNAQNNIKQKYKHSRKHTKQINPKKTHRTI